MEYSPRDPQLGWFCNVIPNSPNNQGAAASPHSTITYTLPQLQHFSIDTSFPTPQTTINAVNAQITSLTVKNPDCLQCKGWKHNFTAYFHNAKIFSSPPHALIGVIETSYIQTRHLKSLLSKYRQGLQKDSTEGVELEINNWVRQVAALATEVRIAAPDSQAVVEALRGVNLWGEELGKVLWEQVFRLRKLDIMKEKVKALVVAFRKAWERVWIACVQQDDVSKNSAICFPSQIV